MEFQTVKYKETDTMIIKGLEDLTTTFEESSIKILALKNNSYSKHYIDRILRVEKEIKIVVEALEEWIKVQKSWVYLEPIFAQRDIAVQMENESKKFRMQDGVYRREVNYAHIDPNVHRFCRKQGLIAELTHMNYEFEQITKSLSTYLEAKREFFVRFYFLSNEEILEIISQMREPRNVQKFLGKIFEGIDSLQFGSDNSIQGVYSKEEEFLQLKNEINTMIHAEGWLKVLETEMKQAVRYAIHESVQEYQQESYDQWVQKWHG